VGCPPAVPIVVSGERIDESAEECFAYYGITHCAVIV
jgi:arginine/lysine/ornithine decarboxylase